MNETVIYSIFKNGSDAAALAGLIEVLVLAGFFTFLIIRLRHAKRNGHPRVSRSAQITKLWNFLADHAPSAIAAICCLAFALTVTLLRLETTKSWSVHWMHIELPVLPDIIIRNACWIASLVSILECFVKETPLS